VSRKAVTRNVPDVLKLFHSHSGMDNPDVLKLFHRHSVWMIRILSEMSDYHLIAQLMSSVLISSLR
jgi:hypothetical protein